MALFSRPQSTAVRIAKPTSDEDSFSSKPSPRKGQCAQCSLRGLLYAALPRSNMCFYTILILLVEIIVRFCSETMPQYCYPWVSDCSTVVIYMCYYCEVFFVISNNGKLICIYISCHFNLTLRLTLTFAALASSKTKGVSITIHRYAYHPSILFSDKSILTISILP